MFDKADKSYIVKIANAGNEEQTITLNFKGLKKLPAAKVTTLHADDPKATSPLESKENVVPRTADIAETAGSSITIKIPAQTFAVYNF